MVEYQYINNQANNSIWTIKNSFILLGLVILGITLGIFICNIEWFKAEPSKSYTTKLSNLSYVSLTGPFGYFIENEEVLEVDLQYFEKVKNMKLTCEDEEAKKSINNAKKWGIVLLGKTSTGYDYVYSVKPELPEIDTQTREDIVKNGYTFSTDNFMYVIYKLGLLQPEYRVYPSYSLGIFNGSSQQISGKFKLSPA